MTDPQKPDENSKPISNRKPAGMKWESFADRLIQQAESEGAFANLPGKGKPIAGLDQPYDANWWVKQYVKRENISLRPGHLQVKQQVEEELQRVLKFNTEAAVRRGMQQINEIIREANRSVTVGPASTLTKLDEEKVVEQWRKGV